MKKEKDATIQGCYKEYTHKIIHSPGAAAATIASRSGSQLQNWASAFAHADLHALASASAFARKNLQTAIGRLDDAVAYDLDATAAAAAASSSVALELHLAGAALGRRRCRQVQLNRVAAAAAVVLAHHYACLL